MKKAHNNNSVQDMKKAHNNNSVQDSY